jgi:hypothetical protein
MTANSKRQHKTFDSSVYAAINKCSFIPDTAFEYIQLVDYLGNGQCIRLYASDNRRYVRAVLFDNKQDKQGICGLLVNSRTHEIIYCETKENHRNNGIYKQLRAYMVIRGYRLWSVHHTDLMLSKLAS